MSRLIVWTMDEQGHLHATGETVTGKTVTYELTPVVATASLCKRRYTVARNGLRLGFIDFTQAEAKRAVLDDFAGRFDDVEYPDRLPRRAD